MFDSNDGPKYVGLLSMVAIRQRLALMPTQKSKCEESLEFLNWLPWRMPKIEDWLPDDPVWGEPFSGILAILAGKCSF
jgi:hypothetical protein